jgi:Gpi18-like mannosyltransferase
VRLTQLSKFISVNKLAVIISIGVLARLILMPITAHPADMYVWYTLSTRIANYGPLSVSLFPPVNNYFMLIPVSYAYKLLATVFSIKPIPVSSVSSALIFFPELHQTVIPDVLFNFLSKLPLLFSDIFSTLMIFKIVKKITGKTGPAESAALLWFLNPYLIWISASWGMWDSMAALFSILCLHFLLERKIAISSVCLVVAVAVKFYPVLFIFPIAVYLLKSSLGTLKRNDFGKFLVIFGTGFAFLCLFSLTEFMNFLSIFLSFNMGVGVSALTNPFAFGLTYWSLSGLNLIIKTPLTANVIGVLSSLLMVLCLSVFCFRISKLSFRRPGFDLVSSMLLIIGALFLSFRLVLEQWFVWILPFLVFLVAFGRVDRRLFWGLSFLAFTYSILNCPLPFFFLPLAPAFGNGLLVMVYAFWAVWDIRIIGLAVIGCLFSLLLFIVILRLNRFSN